ncbi:mycothiol system anti-sigma-R factor [Nocardioides rotundus]|uniref:mycothiol system anti-sigma-R factor n=1 Tax=Nocardioides rotundus TaxID=1774216 RepID=UPI001CC027F9|nr:mycothiol system anti-sigma-R factor [Nocardioides rotundus]UAL28497.1 mycothiol system anti-sigma-R factor [Nocardioides rotundus]
MSSLEQPHECVDFVEQIVYLIDNELDDDDVVVVRRHLQECGPCLERYDVQKAVKALVARSCAESAPPELRDRIRLAISKVQVTWSETEAPSAD